VPNETIEKLRTIANLTKYEAKIYLTLLEKGGAKASQLYKKVDVPQPRVYDVVKSLIKKGFVLQSLRENFFEPVDPTFIIKECIAKKRAELRKIEEMTNDVVRELDELYKKRQIISPSVYLIDKDVIGEHFFRILYETEEKFYSTTTVLPGIIFFKREEMVLRVKEILKERKIKGRTIAPLDVWKNERVLTRRDIREELELGWEFAYLDEDYERFILSDVKRVIIFLRDPVEKLVTGAIYTTERDICRLLEEKFERLWEKSVKIDKNNFNEILGG
jgi:sugar-specific transcriptional regulator TrmB